MMSSRRRKALPPLERPQAEQRAIDELQYVANLLKSRRVSEDEFTRHRRSNSVTGISYLFGSSNEAIKAAGLEPYAATHDVRRKFADRDLLDEILRVEEELGRVPSERLFSRHGRFSLAGYRDRWGRFSLAVEAAHELAAKR